MLKDYCFDAPFALFWLANHTHFVHLGIVSPTGKKDMTDYEFEPEHE